VEDFITDVKLVWYNACLYNKPGSVVHDLVRAGEVADPREGRRSREGGGSAAAPLEDQHVDHPLGQVMRGDPMEAGPTARAAPRSIRKCSAR
jgi:hypothetical protein